MTPLRQESARIQALARIADAAASGGTLEGVLRAITEGVRSAFGFNAAVNLFEAEHDRYEVKAAIGEGTGGLIGTTASRRTFEMLMQARFEMVPDVYYVPHHVRPAPQELGITVAATPPYPWPGPGHWHPSDLCMVRMRTIQGKELGLLSVDSPDGEPLPTLEIWEILRLFAMVGANAIENVLLAREVKDLAVEREMKVLRQELQEEVALRRSLLDVGTALGAASDAASGDIFDLLAKRLNAVVPIKTLTIYAVRTDGDLCRPIYHSEPDDPDLPAIMAFSVPFGAGATGGAAALRASVISNVGQDDRLTVDVPDSRDIDEHLMTVPVLVEERTRAVLTMRRPASRRPFTAEDAHRAELFAQHVATAFLLMELAESRRQLSEQVERLQDLNRLKDEFVANVSHELRTPLTAIMGNVMTVAGLGDMLPADQRRELLSAAERQTKRLAELLENLLAESRLSGDAPALSPTRVDLTAFVEEVADTLRFRARERTISVKKKGRPEIVTDRTLLYRILFNLGDNALKYSDGPVRLAVRASEGGACVDVSDEGVGIAPQDVPRIFEQFEQLDGSTLRKVGGVGLGLHLCARAAEVLGGRIEVRSEVDKGSTFTVWLPREMPRPPA